MRRLFASFPQVISSNLFHSFSNQKPMPPKFSLKKPVEPEKQGPINYTETGSVKLLQETRNGTESTVKISAKKGLIGNQDIDLSKFQLIKRIGQESLNEGVDIVLDPVSKHKLVLKKIRIDPKKVKEILSEVNLLASCKHPQIVTLHNALQESGKITLILEFMDCGALSDVVEFFTQVGTIMTETAISQVTESILLGLQYLHEQRNTVHRDLKPANILVNSSGQVKIADFGSAGIDTMTQHLQTFCGSEAYMSPERLKGEKYSYLSDIWSLGIIAAYSAFGKFPFALDDTKTTAGVNVFGLLKVVQNSEFIDFSKIEASKEFQDFIHQCCTVDPSLRPSASELLKHEFITKHKESTPSLKEYVREKYVKKRMEIREQQKKTETK